MSSKLPLQTTEEDEEETVEATARKEISADAAVTGFYQNWMVFSYLNTTYMGTEVVSRWKTCFFVKHSSAACQRGSAVID